MILSDRVDLTEDRDFGRVPPIMAPEFLNLSSELSMRTASIQLQISAGVEEPSFEVIHLYPWQLEEVSGDDRLYQDHYFTDDPWSNEMGFEIYGDPSNPFVLGNSSTRKVRKFMLKEEDCIHCDACGKELSLFDSEVPYLYLCRECSNREAYVRMYSEFLDVDARQRVPEL